MDARAHVVHDLPGRTRLRVQGRRRDEAFFHRLAEALQEREGVTGVKANPVTESVLVRHRLESEELSACLAAVGITLQQPGGRDRKPRLTRQVARQIRGWDRSLDHATDGALDLGTLGFVFLSGAAALQAVRGRFLPATVSLLMYASRRLEWEDEEDPAVEGAGDAGAGPPGGSGP